MMPLMPATLPRTPYVISYVASPHFLMLMPHAHAITPRLSMIDAMSLYNAQMHTLRHAIFSFSIDIAFILFSMPLIDYAFAAAPLYAAAPPLLLPRHAAFCARAVIWICE